METAEGSVYNVLSSLGRVSDKDLVDHMLEAFSDIPTQEDAIDKLRTLRRKDKALIAFNATYTAFDFDDYDEVNFIQNRRPDPRFNSTMKPGYNGNSSQFSSRYQSNSPRNSSFNNTSRSPGQNQSNQSSNQSYQQDRHGAPVGQQRYPPNYSNSYHSNRNFQSGSNQGSPNGYNNSYNRGGYNSSYNPGMQSQSGYNTGYTQGRRYINKYRHPRGIPKEDIRFEFVDSNKYDILKSLRGILRHFEDVSASSGQRAPFPNRYHGEVNESKIHKIGMAELCHMMGKGMDNVYDALVAGDYIEEVINTA